MPVIPPHHFIPHPEFFFTDGNVVFVAGSLAFCLHRSVVSRWSPAFKNMLDALEAENDPCIYDGRGVVALDDAPLHFDRLVRRLYDGIASPIPFCNVETFPLLSSLLILSHKHDIPHLHTQILSRILDEYPLTLAAWDAREKYEFASAGRQNRLDVLRSKHVHPLAVVHLAIQLNMPNLVVPAYLDLARFPVSEIIRGYTTDALTMHLPAAQMTAVLRGKETLQRFIADFIKASIEQRVPPQECRYIDLHGNQGMGYPCMTAFARVAHEMLVMTAGVAGGVDSDPLFVLLCAVEILKEGSDGATRTAGDGAPESFDVRETANNKAACAACINNFRHTVDVARQHIWGSLGKWFGLRAVLEDGFDAQGGWE